MRAVVNGIKMGAMLPKQFLKITVDAVQLFLRAEITGNDRLIGDDNSLYAVPVEKGDGLPRTGEKPKLGLLVEKIHFLIDDAIPVKKDCVDFFVLSAVHKRQLLRIVQAFRHP